MSDREFPELARRESDPAGESIGKGGFVLVADLAGDDLNRQLGCFEQIHGAVHPCDHEKLMRRVAAVPLENT